MQDEVTNHTEEEIRDWFAGQALPAIYKHWNDNIDRADDVARECFEVAEAMMAERKKRQPITAVESKTDQPIQPS